MLVDLIHQQHLYLRELFARHQEALLQGAFDDAERWLNHFIDCQQSHMQIEEQYLFPLFEKIERETRWDTSLYLQEHAKLEKFMQQTKSELEWLMQQDLTDSECRRNIIALIDKQKTLKGLNEHHEDREETAMLKELEQKMETQALKFLVSDIKFTWAEVKAAVSHVE